MIRKIWLLLSLFLILLGAAWALNEKDMQAEHQEQQIMSINKETQPRIQNLNSFKAREYVKLRRRLRDE